MDGYFIKVQVRVNMMLNVTAGTFSLNCSFLGIPCIATLSQILNVCVNQCYRLKSTI